MSEGDEIISVRGLNASFGDRQVLHEVSFSIRRGEITLIIGGSGSGKTTVLKHLLHLYEPPKGTVYIFGKDIAEISEDEQTELYLQMGVIYQNGPCSTL